VTSDGMTIHIGLQKNWSDGSKFVGVGQTDTSI